MKEQKKVSFPSMLILAFVLLLLTYTGYDAFKIRPEIKQRVDTVTTEFRDLKVYLDAKLPEIDSVLILHTNQIQEQNLQLTRINQLTEVLKK